ncbi:MAG: hypothetical protein QMC70_11525 [Bacteroidia bacterium]
MKLDRNKYLESRSMRPRTVLFALLAVNVLLGLIVWLFPANGITIVNEQKLEFVSFGELVGESDIVEVDIDDVLSGLTLQGEIDTAVDSIAIKTIAASKKDSIENRELIDTVKRYRRLQLPANNPFALQTLKYGVKTQSKDKVVRILHYGDSQLEGDRITDYFRNKMQRIYGGEGPGILLPNEPAASSRRSAFVSESKNISKQAIYVKGGSATGKQLGIGAAAFTISGASSKFVEWIDETDSVGNRNAVFTDTNQALAYMQIRIGSSGYYLAKRHSKATLLYGTDEPFVVNIQSDNYVNDYTLPVAGEIGRYTWDIRTKKKLKLIFTKGKFPTIYGLALDGDRGVAVDNFAMRGSSAMGFSKMDIGLYGKQLKEMNVCAIILQYGINVVPNVRSDYGYYKNSLKKQLNSIKAAYPGITILVIGPSDMSLNRGGKMVSYSNIPLIRDAMQEAALESGCCFWDLYEAMGGENSMAAWVKKGLAQKDYTHFSFKGARYVGEMLFNAIHQEINTEQWN